MTERGDSDLDGLDRDAYSQPASQHLRDWGYPSTWAEDAAPLLFIVFLLALVVGAFFYFKD